MMCEIVNFKKGKRREQSSDARPLQVAELLGPRHEEEKARFDNTDSFKPIGQIVNDLTDKLCGK